MMQWFRSYHGAPFDTKLAMVARRANVTRGHAASLWWAVLDFASQSNPRGSVKEIDAEEIAAAFDYEEELVVRVLEAMKHKETLINADGFLSNWNNRQVQKEDDGAAERKQRQREREKEECHAMSRDVTKCPALDTDKDKEKKEEKIARVTLEELSIDHVSDWLEGKRVAGKYLTIDEHGLLEMFKNYCGAKNPKYRDYVAAFKNSFEWERAPKKTGKAPAAKKANDENAAYLADLQKRMNGGKANVAV